ncbi:CPBP family intramembrane metalloprotease [Mucilaginibacter pallidiroseus]|uniref:CPBP family intramembrane metalloprotease n=1 Tax=Mucilaginibacter pallidiroseus TaxID=2599295 RepID=A0A563UEM6_9SPHI|nr:CPBP family intramembrane glutamic endopeptidase [Mucilaginibacter pallidiroseus]TWR29810.1 CPBP family intramembrane metalloprotease [Mucilaginibacter pallidiroseus]
MVKRPVNQMTPGLQFLVFICISIGIILLGTVISFVIVLATQGLDVLLDVLRGTLNNPGIVRALYVLQIVGTTLPIFIAPVVFACYIVKQPAEYLKTTIKINWVLFVAAFFIMMISMPLIELSSNINQKMVLPEFLKGIEDWMKRSEVMARKVTDLLLKMDTVADMIKNLVLVGLLTAIVEEFMFRGVVQTLMMKMTKNLHAAVWITAILFSAFHMEFYGFLPRMIIGAILGYFAAWSGSVWPAVWGHFLNNGTAVVVTYLFQHKMIKTSPDSTHVFNYGSYIFSLIIIIILLLVYKNLAQGKNSHDFNGEELG